MIILDHVCYPRLSYLDMIRSDQVGYRHLVMIRSDQVGYRHLVIIRSDQVGYRHLVMIRSGRLVNGCGCAIPVFLLDGWHVP